MMRRFLLAVFITGLFLLLSCSCGSSGTESSGRFSALNSSTAKPEIDSSRVPETLELYRAKRYESISEALYAGADQVQKLVLYGRELESLPADIRKLKYLASLDVANNKLNELPQEIADLHYLQGFYANGNMLREYPRQLLLLPILEKVDLSVNKIHEIPPEISLMKQLTRLSINHNFLLEIPVEIYELNALTVLELGSNGLREIPRGISNLNALKKLDLSRNQISTLPREITTLSETLTDLNIQGNQISREEIDWLMEAMPKTNIRF
jgi:Leucine-rich repeat (LRR) protein